MNMKKLLSVFAALTLTFASASAQMNDFALGVGAGFRGYVASIFSDGPLLGGFVGVDATAAEAIGPIDLTLGMNLTQVTDFYIYGEGLARATRSLDMQIPLYAQYTFDFDALALSIFAGPTFFCGLSLKDALRSSEGKGTIDLYKEESILFKHSYKRCDCLIGGGISATFIGCIRVHASYDYGLVNRFKDGIIPHNIHNQQLTIGVAYVFGY